MKHTTIFVLLIVTCLAASGSPPLISAEIGARAHDDAARSGFGYGFAQISGDGNHARQLGFNWIQSYDPPTAPQPTRVLYRVKARAADLSDPLAFQSRLRTLVNHYGGYIDAYEIGNEVNLASEWGVSPEADDYATLLSHAQTVLRDADPSATIVSAGLATVGRVSGTWNGHLGHNGSVQDEREYLREFIAANGLQMVDVVGYHPIGFRADYSAEPDVNGGTPETDCGHGLCFRSAEKIHEILQQHSTDDWPIWGTEFGWIVPPSSRCLNDPSWEGRQWQIVSPEKQAENLVGAFQYAQAHWPWMEAMFVFNLDIDTIPYYSFCEQMRYYSINGRPAENSLRAMFKWIYLPVMRRSR
jgi:hypothetical protein